MFFFVGFHRKFLTLFALRIFGEPFLLVRLIHLRKNNKRNMSIVAQSVDAGLAEVCDLILPLEIPRENISVEAILSVLREMINADKTRGQDTAISHVATLSSSGPAVGSSTSSVSEKTFIVLHVSNPSDARTIITTIQHLQASTPYYSFLGRLGWIRRTVVEEHCEACSASSSVLIDPPLTKLEVLLSAKRCQLTRKRPLETLETSDEDDLSCIVLYLSKVHEEDSDRTTQLLAVMEKTASEARWPILSHYLDTIKRRFFLQCPSSTDAAKVRELFIAVAKSGTVPDLQSNVTAISMKLCSLADMKRASSQSS